MNIAETLVKNARTYGERPAISQGETVVRNYRDLEVRTAHLAASMQGQLGLQHGDRVALIMKNCAAYIEVLYACWRAGLAATPINAKLHPREFSFILRDSGARACFITEDLTQAVAEARAEIGAGPEAGPTVTVATPEYEALCQGEGSASASPPAGLLAEVAPDDLAWLFYTSGTTGRPKGAMLSHRNLISMTMNYFADVDSVAPEDTMIHAAPLSHGSGLYALPHVARAANNLIPESGGFDVAEVGRLIRHWPNCTFFLAPTMVSRLIAAPDAKAADFANLKTIVYGGAPMYLSDTLKALALLGPKLVQIYGQGEAPMTITGLGKRYFGEADHPRYHDRLASAGTARTDVEVRLVDESGTPVALGETGEVICRGDVVMSGYWNNPAASAAALRDGWLWSGDVGVMDEDGFLTLKDRSKDMIISGGSNIYPREIEEVLLRHPGVYECAVVGRPHPDWGEEVIAFVVPHPDQSVSGDDLDQLCLDNIARFKRPKDYRFVAALTKNNYGKILKTELRDLLAREA